ncbi:MAG: tetratricopeptide repeat protein [Planctomycetota bacterium]|nr:tetratricopeptide repeat protein [Planctomycetota bacterium]
MKTLELGQLNAGAIFFAVAILATLVFGRFFCGWGCHIVALQDLCGWIMKKLGVRPKPFRSRILVFIPLVLALYMFVWPTLKRTVIAPALRGVWPTIDVDLRIAPFPEQGFSNHLMTEGFWDSFAGPIMAVPFLLVCGFATVYFLGAKGFCTYGCPYGGIFGPVDLISPGKIVVDQNACHQCGHCTAVCTSNVRVHEEIRSFGMVVDPGCMKCLDCVSVCPNGALSFSFARPSVLKGTPRGRAPKRVYDTTLTEDGLLALTFAAVFFAFRSAYDAIPMLMAVGIAGCVTFLAWKLIRVCRDRDVRFSAWQFKRSGRLTRGGGGFVLVMLAVAAATAHTGFVNYHAWRADLAYRRLALSKAEFLGPHPRVLDERQREAAQRALARYDLVRGAAEGGVALLTTLPNTLRAGLLALALGETERATGELRTALARFGPDDELAADLSRLLIAQGRSAEAEAVLEEALRGRPEFWSSREQLAMLRVSSGRAQLALEEAQRALEALPAERFTRTAHARTLLTLARIYSAMQRPGDALAALRRAVETRPEDPVLRENLAAAVFGITGDLAGAIEEQRRAADLDPTATERRVQLGLLLLQAGKPAEALEEFERALARDPLDSSRRAQLSDTLERAGLTAEATRLRTPVPER